ncbi:MAG: hypothetical protein R2855_10825 [Thermomicrobiales bacterium]
MLNLPIAHGEGAYFADDATLDGLEANGPGGFPLTAKPMLPGQPGRQFQWLGAFDRRCLQREG